MFDTIIREGTVIDGTGGPPRRADLGISDGRLVALGDLNGAEARRIISCPSKMVTPGFIDTHVHSDLALLSQPDHLPKITQGITTEILGQDGLSYAPLSQENLARMEQYLSGLNGKPKTAIRGGSVAEFLDMFHRRVAVNVLFLIPHGVLRVEAIGWGNTVCPPSALRKMRSMARRGMEEGACGFSTALTYPPCSFSTTEELVAIAEEIRPYGGVYVTHLRSNLGDGYLDPLREALEIGRRTGVSVHISHLGLAPRFAGKGKELVSFLEMAANDGIDLTWDSYPYVAGSGSLCSLVPDWFLAGGPDIIMQRLQERENYERLVLELGETAYPWEAVLIAGLSEQSPHKNLEGWSIDLIGKEWGVTPGSVVAELLRYERLEVSIVVFGREEDDVAEVSCHPLNMVGSDALLVGGSPHPRTYGAFPRFLRLFVREQQRISWEEAVERITSRPAKRFGLKDRGVLKPGMMADVVILDPETVSDRATYEDSKQLSVGIEHVLVNGELVLEGGMPTGKRPGQALRPSWS